MATPSPRPSAAASVRTPLKRFSHAQIADKVRERSGVAEYEALLMSCAVQQDDSGVVFDSNAPGWRELVRRCEQADRDSERRRKERATDVVGAATARSASLSHSPSPATTLASAPTGSGPSLLSKLGAAMSSAAGRMEQGEAAAESAASARSVGRQSGAVRAQPATAPRAVAASRVRRGSQPTAALPLAAQPTLAGAHSAATSDTDSAQERRSRRERHTAAAATFAPAADRADADNSAALAVEGDTNSTALPQPATAGSAASPVSSDARRVRSARLPQSAAQRTNADRIKRSANKQYRDAQQLQADLAFEHKLSDELDGKYEDSTLSAEWKERRQKEADREAERRRREEEDERQRIAAGGRKKRKLVIPAAGVVRHPHSGSPIDEMEYVQVLLQQLSEPNDALVDWRLVGQLASVTGLPHRHRMRVWSAMLKQSVEASGQQQQQQQPDESEEAEVQELEAALSVVAVSSIDDGNAASGSSSGADSPSSSLPSSSLPSPKLDLINQRTVRVDIDRTLPHFVRMQRSDVKHDMEVMLTAYCKRQHITYKQGMNYLLAPFLFLVSPPLPGATRRSLLRLYSHFISTFVPNTFADDEFGSLQCVFLLFRHLLLYHDPQLCAHLDAAEMGPELYASSWFITLYANRCKMEVVLYLWDTLVLEAEDDCMLHYFVSLALLIANRAAILKEPTVSLPELLTKLSISNRKDAHTLLQRAKQLYRHNTSATMRAKLHSITHARIAIDSPAYTELQQWQALHVDADEVVRHIVQRGAAKADCGSSSTGGGNAEDGADGADRGGPSAQAELKYFVLDCRPSSQYNSGHLPMSFHLDPELLDERRAEELERRLDALSAMRGCHLCLADAAVDDEPLEQVEEGGGGGSSNASSPQLAFLSLMLRRQFKYVSIVSGGFAACHSRMLQLERSSELIDHRPDECLECNGRRFSRKEKKSLFTSVSAGMKRLGMGMIARLDQQQNGGHSAAAHSAAASSAAGMADSAAGGGSHYHNLSAEHKAEHIPDGVVLLPLTQQLKLLLTSLRDRNSLDSAFAPAVARLCAILLGTAIERLDTRERHVHTAAGGLYSGVEGVAPLCTLALTPSAERLLTAAVAPYTQLLRVYRGHTEYQPQHINPEDLSNTPPPVFAAASSANPAAAPSSSAPAPPRVLVDVQLPASVVNYRVLLLVPQLDSHSYPELLSLLTHLQGCGCELSALTVCCITAARPALWSAMAVYPHLALIAAALDEQRHGQLVPGIRQLDSRSAVSASGEREKEQPESGGGGVEQSGAGHQHADYGDRSAEVG